MDMNTPGVTIERAPVSELGALCAKLAEGNKLMDAARFAACFAALAVTRKGACSAMPTREEAEVFQREFEATKHK